MPQPEDSPPSPLPRLTAAQSRAVDRYAIETLGLPGLVLMENAAINTASVVLDLLDDAGELDRDRFRVGILCGGGSNGGDGYAIARQLLGFGVEASVFVVKEPAELTGDAAVNAKAVQNLRIPIHLCRESNEIRNAVEHWRSCHVVVDAILGTGFTGTVREPVASMIEALNGLRSEPAEGKPRPQVLAVDVPSGLDADTGQPGGMAVEADVTVTFVAPKVGFAAPGADRWLGRVVVADIGLPDSAVRAALEAAES